MIQKTLWLEYFNLSAWHSFNVLKDNYLYLYQEVLGSSLEVIKLNWDSYDDQSLLLELKNKCPEKIVFADIRFDLNLWLPLFFKILPEVKFEIHIYGNPIERLKRLTKLEDLEKYSLSFIVGSKVQKEVFSRILCDPEDCRYLPFVTTITHIPVKKTRLPIYLYAGRISHQKNVLPLLSIFQDAFSGSRQVELVIAGAPDNVSLPKTPRGFYLDYVGEKFFEKLDALKNSYPRTNYLGHLDPNTMMETFAGASHFISLSTFEGEDFGLSVCEALSAGLSCTLSLWGGHQEFKDLPQVKTCRITLDHETLAIDKDEVISSLKNNENDPIKSQLSFTNWMRDRKDETKSKIHLTYPKKFNGFNEAFQRHVLKKMDGEFFIHDKEFLSPYWETSTH